MIQETEQHKTFFGKLIAAIGGFFSHLLNGAKSAFEELPQEQQNDIVNGVNISQIIKDGYKEGEDYIVNAVAEQTKTDTSEAQALIRVALKDIGINKDSIQEGLDTIADMVDKGITDNDYNGLWRDIATSAAQWLSSGKLDWVSLGMGLVEWAFQHFINAKPQ